MASATTKNNAKENILQIVNTPDHYMYCYICISVYLGTYTFLKNIEA